MPCSGGQPNSSSDFAARWGTDAVATIGTGGTGLPRFLRPDAFGREACALLSLPSPPSGSQGNALFDGDLLRAENVLHLRLAKPRGVVFKAQAELLVVEMEAPQAVGVRKFPQAPKLLHFQR